MIFNAFERMLAFRYLRAKKAESFVSVTALFSFSGIMLGVATLIIVMSVMNGFRQELFSRILGLNGHLNVYAPSGFLSDYDSLLERVIFLDGIKEASPVVESQSLITFKANSRGILVRGLRANDFERRDTLKDSIVDGSMELYREGQVAIGSVLAEKLRINIGDDITLTSPKVKSTPFGTMPIQRKFKVGAIFDVGMYEYNSGFVFMPLETAQNFFQIPDQVTSIEVFLKNPNALDQMRKSVERAVEGYASVYDWRDMNASFYNALKTERNVMFLILTLIILIAAFNIISSMIMLVKDKGQDIAIMRTMGATSGSMLRVFMLCGASIGMVGTFVGSVIGISFALNIESIRQFLEGLTGTELFSDEIYFLSQLPAVVEWSEVITVIGMAFFLSFAATLYPAWRASKLDPVEALRYE